MRRKNIAVLLIFAAIAMPGLAGCTGPRDIRQRRQRARTTIATHTNDIERYAHGCTP